MSATALAVQSVVKMSSKWLFYMYVNYIDLLCICIVWTN